MRRIVFLLVMIWTSLTPAYVGAQDAQLAQQYFRDGEYEKAALLYQKLFEQNEQNDYIFERYIECLLATEDFARAEASIKMQIKKMPQNSTNYVMYGKLLERQYREEDALAQYREGIAKMPADRYQVVRLANAFITSNKYELAIETYEKGADLLKDTQVFSFNLGDLYRMKGDTPKMIENYLNSIDAEPNRLNNLKTVFQRYLFPEDFKELQKQLYARMQDGVEKEYDAELLAWVFIQQKDYTSALRQAKALDRRMQENGGRVFRLSEVAANDGDYDAAIAGYDYIVAQKGPGSSFYIDARTESLRCRRNKIVEGFQYKMEDVRALELQFNAFLDEFGRSKITAPVILDLAELQALYLNDLDQAIALLSKMIEYPGTEPAVQAHGKLRLADYYLMKGEVWDATLLYSQVDKDFKEDVLGQEARFQNARLSYFNGDFQWAQAQFEILKAATSRLIANDALDLSVFIMDNLGLDSNATALSMYADAELLVFQNRFDEAFGKLDSLVTLFPAHSLEDDVWYLKAKVFSRKREYDQAALMYQAVIEKYPEDIRADNSLFELAELYETHLNDLEKAKALYEKIFIDYSGSTFAVEARKRFRKLRGDHI